MNEEGTNAAADILNNPLAGLQKCNLIQNSLTVRISFAMLRMTYLCIDIAGYILVTHNQPRGCFIGK